MHISEPDPARGELEAVTAKVRRLVAANAGHMTYHGTNTYVVETGSGLALIDPGPDLAAHSDRLIDLCGGDLRSIFLTHAHADHCGAVEAVRRATGAKLVAAANSTYDGGPIDIRLRDGECLDEVVAIETPGHTQDHLCFQFERVIFTGDHVMGWATTAVLAPEGDASAYLGSLRKLGEFRARHYLPAHGPKVANTRRYLTYLIEKAEEKERLLVSNLAASPGRVDQIVASLYGDMSQEMSRVAHRTIEALLIRLERTGKVICENETWRILQ